MQINDLIDRVEKLDGGSELARDLRKFVNKRRLGLVYEESKPEYVRLTSKPVVEGDLVNVLPPRGTMEDMSGDDESDEIWVVESIDDESAHLVELEGDGTCNVVYEDLVAVARFDQTIYCGLAETGRVERGGDKPYHVVINGENYHALELMLFPYFQSTDCIYIDPPYNTGAKDWKYNNNYVGADDAYRHSKWLTFMEDRLRLAKKLLKPENSVLIVTIDEKEYLRLGLLLEQMFPEARIQMVSTIIKPEGTSRKGEFSRTNEFIFFVMVGDMKVQPTTSNMFDPEVISTGSPVPWNNLRRREATSVRRARPNQFYPVFVSTEDGHVVDIGDAMSPDMRKEDVVAPDGSYAVFPLKPDGTEMLWSKQPSTLRRLLSLGYVKVDKWERGANEAIVKYLTEGRENDIETGRAVVTGYGPQGEVEAEYVDESSQLPRTLWNMASHNAQASGSLLVKKLLGENRFDFPKSLYAIEDALRFFVSDNPDAIVVDFFSGSGTTAHATMRLNHQDGGRRRSISVTNNEVSFEEAKSFVRQGLRAGDEGWESHGIARYVTIPRVTAAITGLTPKGVPIKGDYKFNDEFPMADGLEENAIFYDLKYLEPSVITANLAFDEIAPLLWMRAGSVGPIITLGETDPEEATFEVTSAYGVLFDYAWAPEFIEECHERGIDHIFVVTDVDRQYRDMCAEFRGKDVKQLYKSYLRSFEIGQDR